MSTALRILWNSLLTASAAALLAGLFVMAMPPVYQATATVRGESNDLLLVMSGDLLLQAFTAAGVPESDLDGWLEEFSGTGAKGVERLQKNLHVTTGEQPGWIDISVEAANANSAALLANEIAKAYLDRTRINELTKDVRLALFSPVELADRQIAALLEQHTSLVDFRAEKTRLENELNINRQEVQVELNKKNYAEEQAMLASSKTLSDLNDPAAAHAARQVRVQQETLAVLSTRYGNAHSKFQEAEAALNSFEANLDDAFSQAAIRYEQRMSQIDRRVGELEGKKRELEIQIQDLLALLVQKEKLQMSRRSALDRFNGVTRSEERYEFAEAVPGSRAVAGSQVIVVAFVFAFVFLFVAGLMTYRGSRQ